MQDVSLVPEFDYCRRITAGHSRLEEFMKRQQRGMDEPAGSDSVDRERGPGIGTLLLVTACGIGLGMLTAPAAGRQTRRRLGRQLATIGGEVAERWGEVHERFDGIKAA
jgi:hypothetical protein